MEVSPKQRFLDIAHFKRPGDLSLLSSLNYANEATFVEWAKQGAPEQILDAGYRQSYFQFTPVRTLAGIRSAGMADTKLGPGITVRGGYPPLVPGFEPRIIEEDERTVTYTNRGGQTARIIRSSRFQRFQMPMYLDFPVKDRASWQEIKKHLEPETPERWPADWGAYVQEMNSRDEPLSLSVGSFFGYLREWVGVEGLLYMFYDDPALVEDMMDTVLHLETEIIKRTLPEIEVQYAVIWEDMCYKTGPLISPAMVKKYMVPRYKKITELLRSYGVDVIYLDSDGNVEQLVPLWLECGINFIWPFEVAAGNDVVAARKKYGRDLIIGGGIDKRALARDERAIRNEVMSKVPLLLEQGGYFPSLDHVIPPDVSLENYCHFINLMREVAGLTPLSF